MSTYRKDYYDKNKNKFNERSSNYYHKNKERLLAEAKRKREARTPEQIEDDRQARRRSYEKNIDKYRERSKRKWQEVKRLMQQQKEADGGENKDIGNGD